MGHRVAPPLCISSPPGERLWEVSRQLLLPVAVPSRRKNPELCAKMRHLATFPCYCQVCFCWSREIRLATGVDIFGFRYVRRVRWSGTLYGSCPSESSFRESPRTSLPWWYSWRDFFLLSGLEVPQRLIQGMLDSIGCFFLAPIGASVRLRSCQWGEKLQ